MLERSSTRLQAHLSFALCDVSTHLDAGTFLFILGFSLGLFDLCAHFEGVEFQTTADFLLFQLLGLG